MPEINEGVAADAYRSVGVWSLQLSPRPSPSPSPDPRPIPLPRSRWSCRCWRRLLKITAGNLRNERAASISKSAWPGRKYIAEPIIKLNAPLMDSYKLIECQRNVCLRQPQRSYPGSNFQARPGRGWLTRLP